MFKRFGGMNISSKNPKALAEFYCNKLGIPMLSENPSDCNYDGVEIGFSKNEPVIWIWDENKWGKSNSGTVTFVFYCDDIDKTYEQLKNNGTELNPPVTAVWGGKELSCKDLDGNTILILE